MLQQAGFTGLKMWEQPINCVFKNGEEFYDKECKKKFTKRAKSYGLTDEQIKAGRLDIIKAFDHLSGAKTTDLRTF